MSSVNGTAPSLHSTFDETEFVFDTELINTTVYRRAFHCASRKKVKEKDGTLAVDVQSRPVEQSIGPNLAATHEDGDIAEELVTEGARTLSKRHYTSLNCRFAPIDATAPSTSTVLSFGNFTAPPNQAPVTTQKIHRFEVAEFVFPSSHNLDRTSTLKQTEFVSGTDVDDSITEIRKALDGLMVSEFEDVGPQFTREASAAVSKVPLQTDEQTEPTCTSLIDVSIPEVNETRALESSTTYEDLMEISAQDLAHEMSTESATKYDTGLELSQKRPQTLKLQEFLNYQENGFKRAIPESRSVERVFNGSPLTCLGENLLNNESQLFLSENTEGKLSSVTKYTLEELIHSSAVSKVIKGRMAGAEEVVRDPGHIFIYPSTKPL